MTGQEDQGADGAPLLPWWPDSELEAIELGWPNPDPDPDPDDARPYGC